MYTLTNGLPHTIPLLIKALECCHFLQPQAGSEFLKTQWLATNSSPHCPSVPDVSAFASQFLEESFLFICRLATIWRKNDSPTKKLHSFEISADFLHSRFASAFLLGWTKSNETKWWLEGISRQIQNGTIQLLTRPQSWDYPLPSRALISSRDNCPTSGAPLVNDK